MDILKRIMNWLSNSGIIMWINGLIVITITGFDISYIHF